MPRLILNIRPYLQPCTHTQTQRPQRSTDASQVWEEAAHTPDSRRLTPGGHGEDAEGGGEEAEPDGAGGGMRGGTPEDSGGAAAAAQRNTPSADGAPGSSRSHAKRRVSQVETYDETKRRKTRGWKGVYFTDTRKRAVRENIQVGAALLARADAEQARGGRKRRKLF